jgi:hypothetical protein
MAQVEPEQQLQLLTEAEIRRVLLDLAARRSPGATFCPSEAARLLRPSNWRPLMEPVRKVGFQLVRVGQLRLSQGGQTRHPDEPLKGPLRFSRP